VSDPTLPSCVTYCDIKAGETPADASSVEFKRKLQKAYSACIQSLKDRQQEQQQAEHHEGVRIKVEQREQQEIHIKAPTDAEVVDTARVVVPSAASIELLDSVPVHIEAAVPQTEQGQADRLPQKEQDIAPSKEPLKGKAKKDKIENAKRKKEKGNTPEAKKKKKSKDAKKKKDEL